MIDRLYGIESADERSALRTEIAAIRPSDQTLSVLTRRYRSGNEFLRNQLESIIGQMDFSDDPSRAFVQASKVKEFELFVAITFGLGNSPSSRARQHTLDLMETNEFRADVEKRDSACSSVERILLDTLEPADFQWLETKLVSGMLSVRQRSLALKVADKLPSPEAVTYLSKAVSMAASDEERIRLTESLRSLMSRIRSEEK